MAENNLKHFANDFKGHRIELKKLLQKDLPRIIKREALNHFEESWDKQGFTDSSLQKWDKRNAPAAKTGKRGKVLKSYSKWQNKNTGRAILVSHRTDTKGGHLKDSLRGEIRGSRVIIATDKPYAQVHNEGGKAGRGKGFTMSKRQFLGHSEKLNRKIIDKLNRQMDKILKRYFQHQRCVSNSTG